MNINIRNSEEDQYGNSKENIFLAFNDEAKFLGSAFVYPTINYHITPETPYLIYLGINIPDNMDKVLVGEVSQKLFEKVLERAKETRSYRPELSARIYTGFKYDEDKLYFYIKNGFKEDYSALMEADIPNNFTYNLPENVQVKEAKINTEEEFMEYKTMYDEIFVTPLDKDAYTGQESKPYFKNLSFIVDGKVEAGCTVFEKDGAGYIETLFVLPESRGKGLSKIIMNYIFGYFISKGLNKTKLEVWKLDERAFKLYKSFGYKEIKKLIAYPGISL